MQWIFGDEKRKRATPFDVALESWLPDQASNLGPADSIHCFPYEKSGSTHEESVAVGYMGS
jgi:hypothetical protein